jgi:hypothetical protein
MRATLILSAIATFPVFTATMMSVSALVTDIPSKKDRIQDLSRWSGVVDRPLKAGRTVFAYANSHYQNDSPSTVEQFLETRRGERSW